MTFNAKQHGSDVTADHMDKSYEPQSFETRLYAQWEASGCFKPSGNGTPYTILLPPPNVTGTLHMGHAFQHTLMDALIRYQRMHGRDTLWQMGTDHAGIATEMVVGRNIARDNLTRDGLGREKFIEKVWEWKQESGDTIARQMRRMGASGDWSREVFTMDAMPSHGGGRSVRAVVRRAADLPWPAARELGSGAEDGDLGPRSRQRGRRRVHVVDPVPAQRRHRLPHRRDHAPGDDARRRRADGASGRRTLCAPGRQVGAAAAVRPQDPGHRRRLRGP